MISQRPLLAALLLASTAGCTTEQMTRLVYEGARMHSEGVRSVTTGMPPRDSQSYDQYDAERRRLEGSKRGDSGPLNSP